MHVQHGLLFPLMFWVYTLQENPLKYFFQDPKNLAVCSLNMAHSAHNSLSAWTDNFIFSHNLLFPQLQNCIAKSEMCICALLVFALQVKGLFSGNYKKNKKTPPKNIKKHKKVVSFRSFKWSSNQLTYLFSIINSMLEVINFFWLFGSQVWHYRQNSEAIAGKFSE